MIITSNHLDNGTNIILPRPFTLLNITPKTTIATTIPVPNYAIILGLPKPLTKILIKNSYQISPHHAKTTLCRFYPHRL
ncbi:hypothetical protein [Moraxella lacunata]|uniref:hypothetical protein n=1 Tax=Moraxella lacunata TaxID=477 RepID=UPI003EE31D1C